MKKTVCFALMLFLGGCAVASIPDYSVLHDESRTLIAETTDIGNQTVYKDQELTHYVVNGMDAYCSDLISVDRDKYRCFVIQDGYLVAGLHPLKFEPVPLQNKAPVRTAPK